VCYERESNRANKGTGFPERKEVRRLMVAFCKLGIHIPVMVNTKSTNYIYRVCGSCGKNLGELDPGPEIKVSSTKSAWEEKSKEQAQRIRELETRIIGLEK